MALFTRSRSSRFLLPDTWDQTRRGMEAASDLQHELEKLQTRYIDTWNREHEKQKVFSLAERFPIEFLELRQTGRCIINILESDFDEDEPGDYMRRIKQMIVDVTCVRGPDMAINARITLFRSEIRLKPYSGGEKYARQEGEAGTQDDRFRDEYSGIEHIVTSTGVNDTGLFDANQNDRLLPFEGAGAISMWQIDLPLETNSFNRDSLTDVKLRLLYTSRAGGDSAYSAALKSRREIFSTKGRFVMWNLLTYYNSEWLKFTNKSLGEKIFEIIISRDNLVYSLQSAKQIKEVCIYMQVDNGTIQLSDTDTGAIETSTYLQGIVKYTPKSITNFDEKLTLSLKSTSVLPSRGWLMLLIKM